MSTSYPADFPAERAFDAVEPEVFLWVDPLIMGALLLAALAIAAFAWWLGRYQTSREPDAAEDIWEAISIACASAMRVNSDALPGKAKALRKEVTDRLGPVLVLSDGINKSLKDMDAALKGKTKEPPPGAAAVSSAPVTVVNTSHVVIKTESGDATPPRDGATPPPSPPSADRDMSAEEQADALRRAVSRFNDHWCQKAPRIAELRAARRALIHTAPVPHRPGHVGKPRH